MKEDFLHIVWKHQLYNVKNLECTKGESLNVLYRGIYNTTDGPDFLESSISVGQTRWFGSIEIHVNSSDWNKHKHSADANYKNVILHVVWNHDVEISELKCPTLELKGRVPKYYYDNYIKLQQQKDLLPCSETISDIDEFWLSFYKEKLIIERFKAKSENILNTFSAIKLDKIYQVFLFTLGLTKNSEGFHELSKRLPYHLILKYKGDKKKLEALLFGVSGFLENAPHSNYVKTLQQEFLMQKTLHKLTTMSKTHWNFMRVRPQGFPTIKLALLADLFSKIPSIENFVLHSSPKKIKETLAYLSVSEYWLTHFTFAKSSSNKKKGLGRTSLTKLWINCILPLRQIYAQNNIEVVQESIDWLLNETAERNSVTSLMQENGFENHNAFDSQFLIHKYKNFCIDRKCLTCGIGLRILKRNGTKT